MKKFLSAIALACAILLTACDRSQPRPMTVDVPPPVEQKNETLKVYYAELGSLAGRFLETAATMYRVQFPDRTLELEKYAPEEVEEWNALNEKMLAQVMSGEGPDVFLLSIGWMDVEKLARTGVFADMEPYFQADNYDWSDFNQAVMDAGVWEGKRLVIPLLYDLPIFYTSIEALEETGFDVENCGTYRGFLDEAEKYVHDPSQSRDLLNYYGYFLAIPQYAGIPYLDYDTGTIDLSAPELKKAAELYQAVFNDRIIYGPDFGISEAADIRDGVSLWTKAFPPIYEAIYCSGAIKTFSEPITLPLRDKDGSLRAEITDAVAVRNNSENLQNAYDFVKILLSEELGRETALWRWREYSVRYSSIYAAFDHEVTNRQTPFILPNEPIAGFTEIIPPTREEFERFLNYTKEVTSAYYPNRTTSFMRNLANAGYVEGKVTYEEFIKDFQRQLEIYLSE